MRLILILLVALGVGDAAEAAALPIGTFTKPCSLFEEDDYLVSRIELEGEKWVRVRTAYEEDSCATPWIEYREEARVKRFENSEIDWEFSRASYLPLTAEVAEALNISQFCGFADWRSGVPKAVSGRACDDFKVPENGATVYGTLRVEAGGALRIGEDSGSRDGSRPELRPNRWEKEAYLRDKL